MARKKQTIWKIFTENSVIFSQMVVFLVGLIFFSFMCIFFVYFFKKSVIQSDIAKLNSIYAPTIINEQSYYFVKTNYRNISFNQCVRSGVFVSDLIKSQGLYGECLELYDLWTSSSKRGVFLDLGANIGSCSFLFAQKGIKVYAFEPLANNLFAFTITTFSNAKFKEYISIYPYALGKEERKEIIHIQKDNWGASSVYYNHTDYHETVQVKKLDDFSNIIPNQIDLIKIDVEGGEYGLLEGGKEFFKNHKSDYMHIESTCGDKNKDGLYEIEKLYNLLDEMGYNVIKKINCEFNSKLNYVFVAKRK